jgi:hypothetical protein
MDRDMDHAFLAVPSQRRCRPLSDDPYMTLTKARIVAADLDLDVNL